VISSSVSSTNSSSMCLDFYFIHILTSIK
jgi:hypothetical protein